MDLKQLKDEVEALLRGRGPQSVPFAHGRPTPGASVIPVITENLHQFRGVVAFPQTVAAALESLQQDGRIRVLGAGGLPVITCLPEQAAKFLQQDEARRQEMIRTSAEDEADRVAAERLNLLLQPLTSESSFLEDLKERLDQKAERQMIRDEPTAPVKEPPPELSELEVRAWRLLWGQQDGGFYRSSIRTLFVKRHGVSWREANRIYRLLGECGAYKRLPVPAGGHLHILYEVFPPPEQ